MFGVRLLLVTRKAVGTKEHIFLNFCCDAEDPLRCVVQNSELLHNYAHAGLTKIGNVFPCILCVHLKGKDNQQNSKDCRVNPPCYRIAWLNSRHLISTIPKNFVYVNDLPSCLKIASCA